ncbi:MAG: GNAT family N-acetyltransferase [Bacillota bacterium]
MNPRRYCEDDLGSIEKINMYCALSIRYHRDVKPENVLCVVGENGEIAGVGYLKPTQIEADAKRVFEISTFVDNVSADGHGFAIEGILVDGFIRRANEMELMEPGEDVRLRCFCEADEIDRMQLLMEKGFYPNAVIPVLKYDLHRETKHYQIPDTVQIRELSFKDDEIAKYVSADLMTGESPQSRAEIRFKSGDPSFKCFIAVCNAEVVGAVSVWDISEERAATENIFVIEPYRRKNIARELLATALDELKGRGKKIATLSVRGTNVPAIRLYLSCGYTLYYNLVEMVYG